VGLTSSRAVELVGIPPSGIGLYPGSGPVGGDTCDGTQPAGQVYGVNGRWPVGPLPVCLCAGLEVHGIGDIPVARASQLAPIARDIEYIPEGLKEVPSVGDWSNSMAPVPDIKVYHIE